MSAVWVPFSMAITRLQRDDSLPLPTFALQQAIHSARAFPNPRRFLPGRVSAAAWV